MNKILITCFFVISFLLYACGNDGLDKEEEVRTEANKVEKVAFQRFLQNFDTISPPCQVGILPKLFKLTDSTHTFLRTRLDSMPLLTISHEFEGMWKRTHHDKFHINEHKPMAGVAVIAQNEKFTLLEIADLEEFSYNDSLYSFRKTTFLCSFDPLGNYINGIAACYTQGDPMGGVERKTSVSQDLKIQVEEFGYDKIELPKGYKLNALYQVEPDGKFKPLDNTLTKSKKD
jgi:hypothetical protein